MRQNFKNSNEKRIAESQVEQKYTNLARATAEQDLLQNNLDKSLYRNNPSEWREKYASEIEQKMSSQEYKNSIALLKLHNVRNVLANRASSYMLTNPSEFKKQDRRRNLIPANAGEVYSSMSRNAFDAVLDLNQKNSPYFLGRTDVTLHHQKVEAGVKITAAQTVNAVENMHKKGKIVFYDFETLGGQNEFNQRVLDQITEFNFSVADVKTKQSGQTYGSIVGSTQKAFDDHIAIIDKFRSGAQMSNRENVILDRLARMGKSEVDFENGKDGVFNYKTFAGAEDILGMNTEDMVAGAHQLRKVGKLQESAGLVEYGGHKMYGWEREFYRGIDAIKKNGFTAVGFNSADFDLPAANQFLMNGLWSAGGKSYRGQLLGNQSLRFDNHLDILAALRQLHPDRSNLYTEEQAAVNKKLGLSAFQQEALVRKFNPNFYVGKPAHMAATDVSAGIFLALDSGLFDKNHKNSLLPHAKQKMQNIVGGRQQLFYAAEGINPSRFGLTGFVSDAYTGTLRTTDGFSLGEKSVTKELFPQFGLQKGVSYTVESITGVTQTDKMREHMKLINPELDINELTSITFRPVSNSKSFKAASPITLMGSSDRIEQMMNQEMFLIGKMGSKGNYVATGVDKATKNALSRITAKDGSVSSNHSFRIKDFIDESTFRLDNESAARISRSFDIKKDMNLLRYVNAMDSYAATDPSANVTVMRDRFRDMVKTKSLATEAKIHRINNGNPMGEKLVASDIEGTFRDYLGYNDFKGKEIKKVFRETIDAALGRETFIRNNAALIQTAATKAKQMAGITDNAPLTGDAAKIVQTHYSNIMSSVRDASILKHGDDVALGMRDSYVREYDTHNFEVNMNGYKGISDPDDIFKVRLNNSGFGLADSLLRHQGLDTNITESQKVRELKKFQEHLIEHGDFDATNASVFTGKELIDVEKDTMETAAQKIMGKMSAEKEVRPFSGILSDTKKYDILTATLPNMGLDAEEAAKAIDDGAAHSANITIANGANMKSHSDRIVDDILFDGTTKEDLIAAGYSSGDAEKLMEMREVRRSNMKDFMSEFLGGAVENGASVGYDVKEKNIFMTAGEETLDLTDMLGKDVFDHGMFHTEINGMRVVSPVGFYKVGYGNNEKITYGSRIKKAHSEVGWMKSALKRGGQDGGNILEEASSVMSKFNSVLRSTTSTYAEDAADIRAGGFVDYRDAVENLNMIWKDHQIPLRNIDEASDRVFKEFLENGKKGDRLSQSQRSAIFEHWEDVRDLLVNGVDNGRQIKKLGGIDFNTKHSYEFIASALDVRDFGEGASSDKRGIGSAVGRSFQFNADEAQKALNESGSSVAIGKPIQTEIASRKGTNPGKGIDYKTDRVIQANRLSIDTKDMRTIVNQYADEFTDNYSLDLASMIHTDEGSASMNPELLDRVFKSRSSEKHVAIKKILEHDSDVIEDLKTKSSVSPTIRITDDGKIVFDYANGVFVQRGEDMAYIRGFNKDSGVKVSAQEDSIVNLGLFSKNGLMADKNSVENFLNSEENRKLIDAAGDKTKKAYELLQDNYRLDYYAKGIDAQPHVKLAELSAEKQMSRAMAAPIGSIDKKVAGTIEKLGLGMLDGVVPNIDIIDSLKEKNLANTPLGVLVNSNRKAKLSDSDIRKAITEDFGAVSDFHKAVMEERYKPWKQTMSVLQKAGILKEGETVDYIGNTFKAEKKHLDAWTVAERLTADLLHKYDGDSKTVLEKISPAISGLYLKDGKILANQEHSINLGKLSEIANNEINTTRTATVDGKTIQAAVGRTTLEQTKNYDSGRNRAEGSKVGKAIKINHRNLEMLDATVYGDASRSRVREGLKDSLGEEKAAYIMNKYLSGENGTVIAGGVSDMIRKGVYSRPGDDSVIEDVGTNSKGEPSIKYNDKVVKKLEDDGISRRSIEAMAKVAAEDGITDFSASAARDQYSALMFSTAQRFNTGKSGLTVDEMKKQGFEVKSLDEILTDKGSRGLNDSIIGKNVILDLKSDKIRGGKLFDSETDRYVALPYLSPSMSGDDAILGEYQKQVASLNRKYTDHVNPAENMTEAKMATSIGNMRSSIKGIKDSISRELTSKKGLVAKTSTAVLSDSGIFTAHGLELFGNEKSNMLSNLSFDGNNLSKENAKGAKGLEFDYAIASKKTMNSLYGDNVFKQLGLGEELTKQIQEKTYERLRTEGTLSLGVREPNEYRKSTAVQAMFFSDRVTGDQMVMGAVGFESQKGDYDSDKAEMGLLKGKADIYHEGKKVATSKIDYAMYQTLQNTEGIDVKLHQDTEKLFNDAKASMYHNASYGNKQYRVDREDFADRSYSTEQFKEYTVNGRGSGELISGRVYTPEQSASHSRMYSSLEDEVRKSAGQSFDEMKFEDQRSTIYDHIKQNYSGQEYQQRYDAMAHELQKRTYDMSVSAKALKEGAGEVNYHTFNFFRVAKHSGAFNDDELNELVQVRTAIDESFLSPKNEKGAADIEKLDKLNAAVSRVYDAARKTGNTEERVAAKNGMVELLTPILAARASKEGSKLPGVDPGSGSASMDQIRHAAETFASVAERVDLRGVDRKAFNFYTTKGVDSSNLLSVMQEDNSMLEESARRINKTAEKLNYSEKLYDERMSARALKEENIVRLERETPRLESSLLMERISRPTAPSARQATAKDLVGSIASAVEHTKITGKGIAKGVADIAGALMLSGYSSSPASPAATQAAGATEEYNDMYATEVPKLSDSNMNVMRGGPKQGYVININAHSPNGQEEAVNAVNSAIGGAVPSSSSINISMNTSFADQISQLQVSKMVANAF